MAEVKVLIDLKELDVMLNHAIVAGIHLQQIHKWPAGLSPVPENFREERDEQREDLLQYHGIPGQRT